MKLDGQVAVITGSGRGIGRAIALAYAREGAKLALGARNESELQEAVSAVSELGAEAIAVRTDVTSQKDTERLAHRVVEGSGVLTCWSTTPETPALSARCRATTSPTG